MKRELTSSASQSAFRRDATLPGGEFQLFLVLSEREGPPGEGPPMSAQTVCASLAPHGLVPPEECTGPPVPPYAQPVCV